MDWAAGARMDLLLEPTQTPEFAALVRALEASLEGERATVVTWLPTEGRPLRRAVILASGEVVFRSPGLDRRAAVSWAALLAEGHRCVCGTPGSAAAAGGAGCGRRCQTGGQHRPPSGMEHYGSRWTAASGAGGTVSDG